MSKKKKLSNRVEQLLDELLVEHETPEEILGESGLIKYVMHELGITQNIVAIAVEYAQG